MRLKTFFISRRISRNSHKVSVVNNFWKQGKTNNDTKIYVFLEFVHMQ